jgi:hypothetical protein
MFMEGVRPYYRTLRRRDRSVRAGGALRHHCTETSRISRRSAGSGSGLPVALSAAMLMHATSGGYALGDGLGMREVVEEPGRERVEVLTVAEALTSDDTEYGIRTRVGALAGIPTTAVAPVYRLERRGAVLQITAALPDGARLSTILEQLHMGSISLTDDALVELVARVIRAVAALHAAPGVLAHGALTPAHIVVTPRDVVLTDAVFGSVLQGLSWNREQMWRTFRVALPPAANEVRFDQRTDVCQLGAVALAIVLRRPLTADEYPRASASLVAAATDRLACGSAMRMWLQQSLQLHPRATFASVVEAGQAFAEMLAAATGRQSVRRMFPPPPVRTRFTSARPA